jgi:sulfate/thiosulfate transport system ATP-binding protein
MSTNIVVEGLTKRFGSFTAVDDVSFVADEGKITALLGPSGSGKSTVLRVLAGLEVPDAGRIRIGEQEITGTSVQDRRFGFVFQHFALFRHMTVGENVAFALSVRREPRDAIRSRVTELLDLVQLTPFVGRYPDQLSGGQRQRVALARALAAHPRVLLLDEPFGALDARVRQELRTWLDELHRELGVTSVLVTHDQEEALELAHRIVVMHRGQLQQVGPPQEIYSRPANPFVAGFVGSANVIRGIVMEGRVAFDAYSIGGADHLPDGTVAHAFVRPHAVHVARIAMDTAKLPARIERATNLGPVTKLHLRLADGQRVAAQVTAEEAYGMTDGMEVFVDLREAKVFEEEAAAEAEQLIAEDARLVAG